MTEPRPAPIRRPDTARPRQPSPPNVEPPGPAELEAVERHLVTLPQHEGATIEVDEALGVLLVRGPGRGPDTTYAAMSHWDRGTWPDALADVAARMRADGAWPSLLLTDRLGQPSDLARQLEGEGWLPVAREAVLWVGHASIVPHLDARLRIEAVQARSVDLHESLERRIFGTSEELAAARRSALATGLEAGTGRAWIVWLGDEPVAVARLWQAAGNAALQGIGVTEERRGQGFGTLITTIATRAGLAMGNRLVWLSVRTDNTPAMRVYARLGFQRAFSWTRWLTASDPLQG